MSAPVPQAARAVVADDGEINVSLYDASGCIARLDLDPATACQIARDLLDAACRRMGRDRERTAAWDARFAGPAGEGGER